jgi:hypothetical protein
MHRLALMAKILKVSTNELLLRLGGEVVPEPSRAPRPLKTGISDPPFTILSIPLLTAGADPSQGAEMIVNEDEFIVRVDGDCLEPEIESGSYLVMSRTRKASIGEVVLVAVNGEYHLKRLVQRNGMTELGSRLGRLSVPSDGVEYHGTRVRTLGR